MFPEGRKAGRGAKGRSGRKTKKEELLKYLNSTLNVGLANEIHNETLEAIKNTPVKSRKHEELKDFVIPASVKTIRQEATITLKTPKPLDDMSDIVANVSPKVV